MASGEWKMVGTLPVSQDDITVIGFDPSSTAFGICVVKDREVHVSQGDFTPGPDRWDKIYTMVRNITGACAADGSIQAIVIEDMVASQASSALYAGQVFGVSALGIRHALAADAETRVLAVSPSSMKKLVTGKGNAEKDHILLALLKLYGIDCTTCTNNEADAIGHALCALAILGVLDIPAIRMLKADKIRDLRAAHAPKPKKPRTLRSKSDGNQAEG